MTRDDRGSILPLTLGFFLLALLVVGAAVALGETFVDQRDLQAVCDGAATAAAASAADLDRDSTIGTGDSLRFADPVTAVGTYLARDPARRRVTARVQLSRDRTRLTVQCEETFELPFGSLLGHPRVHHRATSTARAAVA
jgi:uncharacterized membrane protein